LLLCLLLLWLHQDLLCACQVGQGRAWLASSLSRLLSNNSQWATPALRGGRHTMLLLLLLDLQLCKRALREPLQLPLQLLHLRLHLHQVVQELLVSLMQLLLLLLLQGLLHLWLQMLRCELRKLQLHLLLLLRLQLRLLLDVWCATPHLAVCWRGSCTIKHGMARHLHGGNPTIPQVPGRHHHTLQHAMLLLLLHVLLELLCRQAWQDLLLYCLQLCRLLLQPLASQLVLHNHKWLCHWRLLLLLLLHGGIACTMRQPLRSELTHLLLLLLLLLLHVCWLLPGLPWLLHLLPCGIALQCLLHLVLELLLRLWRSLRCAMEGQLLLLVCLLGLLLWSNLHSSCQLIKFGQDIVYCRQRNLLPNNGTSTATTTPNRGPHHD
jgi:hypothetical protein